MSIATLTVQDVAERVGGTVEGDSAAAVRDVKPIAEAGPGEITFLANQKYQSEFARSQATCVVVPAGATLPPPGPGRAWIRHLEPYVAFAKLVAIFRPAPPVPPVGVHPGAHVAADVVLGADVSVGAGAVVESGAVLGDRVVVGPLAYVGHGARLGEGTKLYARAVVYYGCVIGKRCILHAGSVIGADGFGYAMDMEGRHQKIPQAGNVVLEDDVEVGANAAIDRAVLGSTRIGAGTKIDNLVQVAHNVEVGAGSILIAQCGISGSTKLGQYVVIAAQAGIVGHIEIGDLAQVGAQAGVSKSIPPGMKVMGAPAVEARDGLRAYALIDRLPEMKKRLADLERRLAKVEGAKAGG